jgi:hypothetical protein
MPSRSIEDRNRQVVDCSVRLFRSTVPTRLDDLAASFLLTDPDDNAVTAQAFGVGDGSTTLFQPARPSGVYVEPLFDLNAAAVDLRQRRVPHARPRRCRSATRRGMPQQGRTAMLSAMTARPGCSPATIFTGR